MGKLSLEGEAILDVLMDSPEVHAIVREACARLSLPPPEEEVAMKRDGQERQVTDFEAYHLMEKALAIMVAGGAKEKRAHRKAAALVAKETGLYADVVRSKHRRVARTLTEEERMEYRRSLRM